MWLPIRRYSTAFYLISLIVVFSVAATGQNIVLVLFLLVVEILAGCWYTLSYIPFGRKLVMTFFRSTGACMPCFAVHDYFKEMYEKQFPPPTTVEKMQATMVPQKDNSVLGKMKASLAPPPKDESMIGKMKATLAPPPKKDTTFMGKMQSIFGEDDEA